MEGEKPQSSALANQKWPGTTCIPPTGSLIASGKNPKLFSCLGNNTRATIWRWLPSNSGQGWVFRPAVPLNHDSRDGLCFSLALSSYVFFIFALLFVCVFLRVFVCCLCLLFLHVCLFVCLFVRVCGILWGDVPELSPKGPKGHPWRLLQWCEPSSLV